GISRLISYPSHAFIPNLHVERLLSILGVDDQHRIVFVVALSLPIAMCWAIVRDVVATIEFAVTYLGVLLFALLWQFTGGSRHQGVLFLALVGAVWTHRAAAPPVRQISWVWLAILLINAAGG